MKTLKHVCSLLLLGVIVLIALSLSGCKKDDAAIRSQAELWAAYSESHVSACTIPNGGGCAPGHEEAMLCVVKNTHCNYLIRCDKDKCAKVEELCGDKRPDPKAEAIKNKNAVVNPL